MTADSTKQSLPNRFDSDEACPRIYQFWEQQGYFHAEPDEQSQPYSIVIPPPNVTGALHLGHALNNTLQDICIRMKRMQGFESLWMPGTDHAGIATQAVVERRLREEHGKTRHDLGREKLVEHIWAWKDQYEARILSQLKQMGCSCDWERTRFTLDETCARAVRHTFFDLFQKGLIYRGKRLVNWDTFLQTAVSDDEVFHEPVKGHFWHFRYPVIDPQPGEPEYVSIVTTRPETMLGDTAVAVHPDPAAALATAQAELAEKLQSAPAKEREATRAELDNVIQRRQSLLPELEKLRDMARAGRMVMLPLLEREIPLVADEWAKPDLGSGCVKITPAHDPNDYEVGLRCNLPMINVLHPDGTLNESAGDYQGLTVAAARARVVADLEERGLVTAVEDREIDLAHSDRSKTPIEPYLADQWFVKMDDLAQSAMDAVTDGRVKIFPPRYAKGYLDWLSEKRDWPVSRQLWWGHQIPIWSYVCNTQELHDKLVAELSADADVISGRVSFQVEKDIERAAAERRDNTVQGATKVKLPYATIHVCIDQDDEELAAKHRQRGFARETDVLDTWFSSALWPHSTLGWPQRTPELEYFYPTSVLITSRDIITLWVARMVLTGLNNMHDVPFREVFIHPKILDGYGETMSKMKGNGVDPLDVIDKFGPDALRFSLAKMTTETQDVRMPVQFECPHCQMLLDQTKKSRQLPRIECKKCGQPFSTQWASSDADKALPRGAVVSERFEEGRNFCNKLWNAARFALMNLEGCAAAPIDDSELAVEDRWILSRLATVTRQSTEALESYHFGDAARTLYDFAWEEFCSFYIEMAKGRLQHDESRRVAQRVLAHTLGALLRLLHPIMPFITEEIWRLLGEAAPQRGIEDLQEAGESIMLAPWPQVDEARIDARIESQFALFQAALRALREIRMSQGISGQASLKFGIRCEDHIARQLKPMEQHFESMANAVAYGWGPDVEPTNTSAVVNRVSFDVFVDLEGLIDKKAEIERNTKLKADLEKQIKGKEGKLANTSFVERAPADIVQRERDSLAQLTEQLQTVEAALAALRQ